MDNSKSQFVMFAGLTALAQPKIELDYKICGLQKEEVEKCSKELQDAIGDNKELRQSFENYKKAIDKFHLEIIQQYYKEGFYFGSQLMIDILKHEKKDKANKK